MLAAWGITTGGKPAFIGLAPGTGESADAWAGFLADLKDRGLDSPLLVISDGAPGLIAAIEQAFPAALRQRCVIHRARNVLAKIPAGMQAEVKDAYWAIFDTENLKTAPGPRLVEIIDARISEMAARYQALYPAAVKCLTTDREGLTACDALKIRCRSRRTSPSQARQSISSQLAGAFFGAGPQVRSR